MKRHHHCQWDLNAGLISPMINSSALCWVYKHPLKLTKIYRNCNFFNWIISNWICCFISHTYLFYYWLNPNISMSQKIPCCKSLKTAGCPHRPDYSVRAKVWTGNGNPYLNYEQIIPTDRHPISYCVNYSTMFQENIHIKTQEKFLFLYLFSKGTQSEAVVLSSVLPKM